MRFKKLKDGDIKWVKKFALLPRMVENTKIWLECYYIKCVVWEGRWHSAHSTRLPENPEVQKYLLQKTALGKALNED